MLLAIPGCRAQCGAGGATITKITPQHGSMEGGTELHIEGGGLKKECVPSPLGFTFWRLPPHTQYYALFFLLA